MDNYDELAAKAQEAKAAANTKAAASTSDVVAALVDILASHERRLEQLVYVASLQGHPLRSDLLALRRSVSNLGRLLR